MTPNNSKRFKDLTFEGFRYLAKDVSLSQYEKIGFPDSYREGKEESILRDITRKMDNLNLTNQVVLDIGPGCSGLALMVIELCRNQGHNLLLVDSKEMLDQLPDELFITKIPAYYPSDCLWIFDEYAGKVNAILTYSVLQYVFAEGNLFDFLDRSLGLLADGGQMLMGDIPNVSKRKRFFSSTRGVNFHKEFTGTNEAPSVLFNVSNIGEIDDNVIISLLLRCRSSGFDAYWLSQSSDLPMANRREDILIIKP